MLSSLKRIWTLTLRNIKEILRDPLSLIFTLIMPLGMEILFYVIFHKMTSQFEMKYLAPGIVVFSQAFLALFVGLLIALDRSSSFLTRLFVSKAKPFEFIASYASAIIPIVLLQSVLFFVVGMIIDPSLISYRIIIAVAVSLLTSLLFISIGILLGSIFNEKSIGGVASIVIAGQSLLSGMWFPIEGLSSGIISFMNILPFRNATKLVQNIILGINNPFDDFIKPLIIVLAYTIIIFILSILFFRKKMKIK